VPLLLSDLIEQARLAARALVEYGEGLVTPTVRLGITGLSRAGKTVFITALVHSLVRNGRFPVFEALAEGRIARARLAPQPDDAVPRFDYENHVAALVKDRVWPESTRQISELRLVIEFQSRAGAMRELVLDLVDYPGEWLLDLPLLGKSYETWSAESLALSRAEPRLRLATPWHAHLAGLDPAAPAQEADAIAAARLFTDYLIACRDERYALSLLPPGRFLMPGELAGSPALTFAPLDLRPAPGDPDGGITPTGAAPEGSLWAMIAPALRRLQGCRGAAVLPRAFCEARSPDRAHRCARRLQRRAGGGPRPRRHLQVAARLFRDRAQDVPFVAAPSARRPHPVRRHQGRPPASHEP
jgi:uncharacterized protein